MQKTTIFGITTLASAATLGGYVLLSGALNPAVPCGNTATGAAIGGPFTLISETGATVTDRDVITKPTLVYFGYTFCPDVCPLDNARNAQAVYMLQERGYDVGAVFISIDPQRDTPEVVRDYTDNFHEDMLGLTGSPEQISVASRAYKTYYRALEDDPEYYLVDHSTQTYLMFPDAGFATFFRRDTPPQQVADTMACFIDSAG